MKNMLIRFDSVDKLPTMKKILVGIVSLAAIITACSAEYENISAEPGFVLAGGYSFGECIKVCKVAVEIKGSNISYTSYSNGGNSTTKQCSGNVPANILTNATQTFDFEAFKALPSIIGCPDCTDGGAEWVEVKKGKQSHKVTFEYNKPPKELVELSKMFHTQFTVFQNCSK